MGDARAEQLGDLEQLVGGLHGAGAREDRHPLTGVEDLRGLAQGGLTGNLRRLAVARVGVHRAMRVRCVCDRVLLLRVIGKNQARDRALGARDADRAIDEVADLRGMGRHVDVLVRDVLEQRDEVDLLLVAAAERGLRLLADDREHGLMVELGVVEAVEQMDRPRTRGREADPDLAGELRVRARHQRRHLLVAHLNELKRAGCVDAGAPAVSHP